jgi:hypothetical protein
MKYRNIVWGIGKLAPPLLQAHQLVKKLPCTDGLNPHRPKSVSLDMPPNFDLTKHWEADVS